jgi:cytochrome P450
MIGTERRGPPGLPLIGNMFGMLGSPVEYIKKVSHDFDGLAQVRVPGQTMWVVSHPTAVKYVLQDRYKNFVRGAALDILDPVFGQGLATSDGDHWRQHRRMMQPAFHKERMGRLVSEMQEEIAAAFAAMPARATVDLRETMMSVTQRVVLRTMFGASLGADEERMQRALATVERHLARHAFDVMPRPLWLPSPDNVAYKRAAQALDAIVFRMIEERQNGKERRGDLLDMLLEARDPESGDAMSRQALRDEAMTIFLAGHETTANTLSWALARLSGDDQAKARVEAEARSGTAAQACVYSRAVLDETLRLYPPAWIFAREAVEDDVILDQQIAKKSLVLISAFAAHRRPDVFPDPERFLPDRFLGNPERPAFSYFPFGGGPHLCIGNHFALAEALLVLQELFASFDVQIAPADHVRPMPAMTLGLSEPVAMTLVRRR